MRHRPVLFLAAIAALTFPACSAMRGPAVADEGSCRPPDVATAEATGELAAAQSQQATGPEASTQQGRRGLAVSPSVAINRGQGDSTSVATSSDASATVSAGAPAVVQTLLGAQTNALQAFDSSDRGPVFRAYLDGLAVIRAQLMAATDPTERTRLETREKEMLATLERLESERARAAVSLAPSFPALTTVVFTNASGSSAGSDKPAVSPENAQAIASGVPAVVKEAKSKPAGGP